MTDRSSSAATNSANGATNTAQRNVIAGHYQIAQKIGEGSFGIIFKGHDLLHGQLPVAIKFESRRSDAPQLRDEFRAYKLLNTQQQRLARSGDNRHVVGVPKVYYFGQEGYYNILVIQLLGPSLEDLFEWCGRRFSIGCVAHIAKQMVQRVQFLHENGLIYRDIKPDNFLVGATNDDNIIYMVDYGMVKQYRDPKTLVHIPYKERKSLSGTARYMSINTHLGREQSRRDDLESLGHVFVYFLKGELPWQGLKAATNKLKYEMIGERKQKIPVETLCSGLPIQFAQYMQYVRQLKFEQDPDYDYLVGLFDQVIQDHPSQYAYDWMALNDGQGWSWSRNKKINLNGYGSGVNKREVSGTARKMSYNNNNNNNSKQNKLVPNERTRLLGQQGQGGQAEEETRSSCWQWTCAGCC